MKGGKWRFPLARRAQVTTLLNDFFGIPGEPRVSILIPGDVLHESERFGRVHECGRLVCERRHNDYSVVLGPGVTVVQGNFPRYGPTRDQNHPRIWGSCGDWRRLVVRMDDVPLSLAEEEWFTILWPEAERRAA